MKKSKVITIILLILAVVFIILGVRQGDLDLTARTATYGDFDVPGTTSWIEMMQPGIRDYASSKIYGDFHPAALIAIGTLFVFTLLISVVNNKKDYIFRKLMQWSMFVIARLGVFRVAGVCPVKRTGLGVFPFLNCQGCEMATGGCPIGMIQRSLMNKSIPFYVLGMIFLFGSVIGRALCGFLCPFGFFSDILDRIFNIKRIRKRFRAHPKLGYIKFFMIAFICTGFVWVAPLFCIYICQGANIYGYVPYYLTTGLEGFVDAFTGGPLTGIFIFHMISIVVLNLLAILISGRWFCRYVCPLGAAYGLFNKFSLVQINHDDNKCNDCGRCQTICPMDINLANKDFLTTTGCIRCGRCVKICNARHFEIAGKIIPSKKDKVKG